MRRIFKGSMYTLLGFLVLFFFAMILGAGFPEGTTQYSLGIGVAAAVICSTPLVMLVMFVTGIASWIERNTGSASKRKNDLGMGVEPYPARLARIMNQLSSDDRAYLQEQLANRRLGVSSDGELMSLDELLDDNSDDKHNSLFTG